MKTLTGMFATLLLVAGYPASAGDCPAEVISAVLKAHAGAKTLSCDDEREEGSTFYEVKIRTADGKKLEVEVDPDGTILVTEERVPSGDVPAAVVHALHAKYADAKIKDAERLTAGTGEVSYEITFVAGAGEKSMTVTEAGVVVDVEDDDDDEHDD